MQRFMNCTVKYLCHGKENVTYVLPSLIMKYLLESMVKFIRLFQCTNRDGSRFPVIIQM